MNKTLQAWASITLMGLSAALPQYIAAVPAEWKPMATAAIALLVAAWHRYQPSPSA